MRLIITSGHNKSLHTIALINSLINNNHKVEGVLLVKTFQVKRIKSYIKQYGMSTVIKKFRAHFLHKESSKLSKEVKYISSLLEKENIEEKTVKSYCKKVNVNVLEVNNLNDENATEFANKIKSDLIVYSGGGILRDTLISTSKYNVLNAHSGPLPEIRGMNAIEWSLLKNITPTTSIHIIDKGIDTGMILLQENIPYEPADNLYDIRGKAVIHNIQLLTRVINKFDEYYKNRKPQSKSDGKQYFVMHHALKELVEQKLRKTELH